MKETIFIRLGKEQVLDIVKHFMFALDFKHPAHGSDLMVLQGFNNDVPYQVMIENRDLFKARGWLLEISRNNTELRDFYEWWSRHVEWIEGVSDGKNGKDLG